MLTYSIHHISRHKVKATTSSVEVGAEMKVAFYNTLWRSSLHIKLQYNSEQQRVFQFINSGVIELVNGLLRKPWRREDHQKVRRRRRCLRLKWSVIAVILIHIGILWSVIIYETSWPIPVHFSRNLFVWRHGKPLLNILFIRAESRDRNWNWKRLRGTRNEKYHHTKIE